MAQKKQTNYESLKNLQLVINVVNEAIAALHDQSRTTEQSPMAKILAVADEAGSDSAASLSDLYYIATAMSTATTHSSAVNKPSEPETYKIGKNTSVLMAALAGVKESRKKANEFMDSVSLTGMLEKGVSATYARKLLQQEKIRLLIAAVEKYYEIAAASKEEADASQQRTAYLGSISILLQKAIKELKADLGIEGV